MSKVETKKERPETPCTAGPSEEFRLFSAITEIPWTDFRQESNISDRPD